MAIMGIVRSNTILYCRHWRETVNFYRDILGLAGRYLSDWMVEFELTDKSFISIADAMRTTVAASGGQAITLSWQVKNIDALHRQLTSLNVAAGSIQNRWGTRFFYFYDPEGHRLEAWADVAS